MTNREQTQEEILAELRQFREMMSKRQESQEKVHGAICNTGAFLKDKTQLGMVGIVGGLVVGAMLFLVGTAITSIPETARQSDLRRRQAEFLQKAEELKAQKIAQPLDKKGDS